MQNCVAASACGIASALYMICSRRGVSRAELARRLEWHREQVDRLFRLDHKSRLDQMEAAFRGPWADSGAAARTVVTARLPELSRRLTEPALRGLGRRLLN